MAVMVHYIFHMCLSFKSFKADFPPVRADHYTEVEDNLCVFQIVCLMAVTCQCYSPTTHTRVTGYV